MKGRDLERWWAETFALAHGGVAVIPHTGCTKEEVDAFYTAYERKAHRKATARQDTAAIREQLAGGQDNNRRRVGT